MGSLDGAETSELVGLYILNKIKQELPHDHIGLYRDDGLAIIDNGNGQKSLKDRTYKPYKKTNDTLLNI